MEMSLTVPVDDIIHVDRNEIISECPQHFGHFLVPPSTENFSVEKEKLRLIKPVDREECVRGDKFITQIKQIASRNNCILADAFLMAKLVKNQELVPSTFYEFGLAGMLICFPGTIFYKEQNLDEMFKVKIKKEFILYMGYMSYGPQPHWYIGQHKLDTVFGSAFCVACIER